MEALDIYINRLLALSQLCGFHLNWDFIHAKGLMSTINWGIPSKRSLNSFIRTTTSLINQLNNLEGVKPEVIEKLEEDLQHAKALLLIGAYTEE